MSRPAAGFMVVAFKGGKKPKFFVDLSFAFGKFAPLFGRTSGFSR